MQEKRHRITLLFNANKAYDRQVIEGVGEYLQASQCNWDIFIEEDFHCRIDNIRDWLGDGVIADFDNPEIEALLTDIDIPVVAVGGSYHNQQDYPTKHYIATDNEALIKAAFLHLKTKGLNRFAFYGIPADKYHRWAAEREHAFQQIMNEQGYQGSIYHGMAVTPDNWIYAQDCLTDWLQTLPAHTGIIAVTDSRARHILQVCEHIGLHIPEQLCVIGIDNEELTRYLSRVALSSVAQGSRQMGYQAAKLLHQLLGQKKLPLQRIRVPANKVIERRSTDYRSLHDPAVIQSMHFIRHHACNGIKVEQVLDAVGLSRSNLEKRFKDEIGQTIHTVIHEEKLNRARQLLINSTLIINEISQICGYPSLQYFYSVFNKEYGMTPKKYRDKHKKADYI